MLLCFGWAARQFGSAWTAAGRAGVFSKHDDAVQYRIGFHPGQDDIHGALSIFALLIFAERTKLKLCGIENVVAHLDDLLYCLGR